LFLLLLIIIIAPYINHVGGVSISSVYRALFSPPLPFLFTFPITAFQPWSASPNHPSKPLTPREILHHYTQRILGTPTRLQKKSADLA
jgi:hypothetical protein